MPSSVACERSEESAICADSFITSPSWPVRTSLSPFDDGRLDEEDVAAGAGDREAGRDARHRRPLGRLLVELLPAERVADRRRSSIATGASTLPDAIRVAVLRSSLPSSRSSWRTPASRVYSETTVSSTSSEMATSSSRRPFRSRWRGQR